MYVNLGFPNIASFPATGAANTIYTDLSTGDLYKWDGVSYISYTPTKAATGLGYKTVQWFNDNPTFLLFHGQHVYLSDGADEFIDAFVIGDGVTELQDLPWKGVKPTTPTLKQVILQDNKTGSSEIKSDQKAPGSTSYRVIGIDNSNKVVISNNASNAGAATFLGPKPISMDAFTGIITAGHDATTGFELVTYQQLIAAIPATFSEFTEPLTLDANNKFVISQAANFIYSIRDKTLGLFLDENDPLEITIDGDNVTYTVTHPAASPGDEIIIKFRN